jgi:hypothetical protein
MSHGPWSLYAIDAIGGNLDGTAGAKLCKIHGVVKMNSNDSPYRVANEFIAGRLAMMLGLPVPPGAIVRVDDETLAYVSLKFGPMGELPPPAFAEEFARDEPALATKIVMFDCWIANPDRHSANLCYAKNQIDPMIFDHEQALLGSSGWRRLDRLENLKDRPILNGCLAPLIISQEYFSDFASRIRFLCRGQDGPMRAVCQEARSVGAILKNEEESLVEVLEYRSSKLIEMLRALPALTGQGVMV